MSANPNWQIFKIDMSAAGEQRIPALFSYLRFIRAVDGAGVTDLDALIFIQPRITGGDPIPMQLNSLVKLPARSDFVLVTWAAQPGLTAWLFMSDQDNQNGVELDAPQTKQLVTSSIGTTLTVSAAVVGLAAGLLVAASGSRQSVTIVNNSASLIYIGHANTVAAANGLPVAAGQSLVIDKTTAAIWAIGAAAALDVRVMVES